MAAAYRERMRVVLVDRLGLDAPPVRKLLGRARFFDAELVVDSTVTDALGRLPEEEVDLILLSGSNDEPQVREALDEHLPHRLHTPVVVLTRVHDDQLALGAVSAGAQDYLVLEGLEPGVLERAVRYAVERHRLLSDLRDLSLYDSLTGLHNRRAFSTLSRQQLKLAERTYSRMLVFFADLDNLKVVNDRFGHQEGDRLLKSTGEVIRKTFRDSDIIARLGGDEFAVLAAETHRRGAEGALMRLRQNISAHNANPRNRTDIELSVGVSLFDPVKPRSLEELISRADKLMYAEKRRKKARAQREGSGVDSIEKSTG